MMGLKDIQKREDALRLVDENGGESGIEFLKSELGKAHGNERLLVNILNEVCDNLGVPARGGDWKDRALLALEVTRGIKLLRVETLTSSTLC